MIAETSIETAHYVSAFERLQKDLHEDACAWLRPRRQQAIERFAESGFPTTRMEEWRYTSVKPIARVAFRPAAGDETKLRRDQASIRGVPHRATPLVRNLQRICLALARDKPLQRLARRTKPHKAPDDLVPLAHQQRRGDRTVNAAGHRDEHLGLGVGFRCGHARS